MSKIIDEEVKAVYVVVDEKGGFKLKSGTAVVFDNGTANINDGELVTARMAGEWLDYFTFSKISDSLYTKAVKLAKKRYGKGAK